MSHIDVIIRFISERGENMDDWKTREKAEYFVNTYSDIILRICITYSLSKEDAFDICQNAYIKLMKKNMVFEDYKKERSYIIKIAVNECKDILKSSRFKKNVSIDKYENTSFLSSHYDEMEILDIIKKLPEKYRNIIYFCCIEGFTSDETSDILGISPSAVRKRLSRARNMIKKYMEVDYEGL